MSDEDDPGHMFTITNSNNSRLEGNAAQGMRLLKADSSDNITALNNSATLAPTTKRTWKNLLVKYAMQIIVGVLTAGIIWYFGFND